MNDHDIIACWISEAQKRKVKEEEGKGGWNIEKERERMREIR